ncbi:3011_t:CDS:2, partial [Gigaspora rosea]
TKNIDMQLHKVKIHMRNALNDLADRAAKKDVQEKEEISINVKETQDESSEEKKKSREGKDTNNREDIFERAEEGPRRQKLLDKRWNNFKKKMVLVTEE